jgi:hypothetical protein
VAEAFLIIRNAFSLSQRQPQRLIKYFTYLISAGVGEVLEEEGEATITILSTPVYHSHTNAHHAHFLPHFEQDQTTLTNLHVNTSSKDCNDHLQICAYASASARWRSG